MIFYCFVCGHLLLMNPLRVFIGIKERVVIEDWFLNLFFWTIAL